MHAFYGRPQVRPRRPEARRWGDHDDPDPNVVTAYRGRLFNHIEILYRRGERELAKQFFEFLGCTIVDTQTDSGVGSSILYVYPEPTCQDRLNNVVYLSEDPRAAVGARTGAGGEAARRRGAP